MELAMSLEELKRRRRNGTSIQILAELNGVGFDTMYKVLGGEQTEEITGERDDVFYSLYVQGLNDSQISRKTGTSRSTVRRWRKEKGLGNNNLKQVDEKKNRKEQNISLVRKLLTEDPDISISELAEEIEVSIPTIYAYKKILKEREA